MLIPEKIESQDISTGIKPSLTYMVDFKKNRIGEKIDKLEAVQQAVFLILATEYEYSPIYPDYGIKIIDLIGQDFYYIISELKRRITEALLSDDRIIEINNFSYDQKLDSLHLTFEVSSVFGNFTSEVKYKI